MQPLSPSNIQFTKHSSHDPQRVMLPAGIPFENLTNPFFWSFVAKRLSAFDSIEVIPEDGSWIAEFYVVQVGDNWARMALKSKTILESVATEETEIPQDYEVKFQGPVIGWGVLRKGERVYPTTKDKKPSSKLDAMTWLRNNTRNLAA